MLRQDIVWFPTSGVLVRGSATGELLDAGFAIDGDVLPVTVTTDDVGVFLGGNELANLVSFVGESFVGVVVTFATPRSGPTIVVGEISRRKVASDSLKVRKNHSFCCLPQMLFSGPSGMVLGLRKSRPSTSQICRSLPQRIVR